VLLPLGDTLTYKLEKVKVIPSHDRDKTAPIASIAAAAIATPTPAPTPAPTATATALARIRPCFSLPTFILRKHERQDDVVQHIHPCRLDFKPWLLSSREVVRAVEFGNYCLFLIGSDQLRDVVQRWGW